jgi:hypothetical protein
MTDTIASLNNNVPASPQFGTDLLAQINTALAAIQPLSATEAGYLDGVTAGTSAASKAVVLDANSKINTIDITALKLNGNACDEAFFAGAKSATVIAAIATADATTATTAIALANANKAKINDIIAKLKTSGIIASA